VNYNHPLMGLDIGDSSIKLSIVSKKENKLSLDYAALIPLSPRNRRSTDQRPLDSESGEADAGNRGGFYEAEKVIGLKSIFKNHAMKKDQIVMNYAGRPPFIRYLKFPVMPENELDEAVRWEAKKLITEPIETRVMDYAVLQKKAEGNQNILEIILVAVDKSDLSEGLGVLWKAGIYPRLMDVNPLALLKVVEFNHPGEMNQEIVFIDIGSSKMEVNISCERVLRFTRQIYLGGNGLTRAIMEKKSVSFEEAEILKKEGGFSDPETEGAIKGEIDRMVLEVQRSIDYYRTQFREGLINKMILMGGTPLMPGFRDYVETQFDFPVVLENPFSSMTGPAGLLKELNPVSSLWASSVGLALRGKIPEQPA
jgi:type IV pilus assembly protein PilM